MSARVAVFLDVDRTLTLDLIQRTFASELRCSEQYEQIEREYQEGGGDRQASQEFGDKLVALFREKQFTEGHVTAIFPKIRLREGAETLLKLPNVDKFFVSSGPSYYIRELALRFGVPAENVCCSVYEFDGIITRCVGPVFNTEKREFVEQHKRGYDVTIGVGDSVQEDRDFVTRCTIPVLFNENDPDCTRVSSLRPIAGFVREIASVLGTPTAAQPQENLVEPALKGHSIVELWVALNEKSAEGKLGVAQIARGLSLPQIWHLFDWSVWTAFVIAVTAVAVGTWGVDHWGVDILSKMATHSTSH